MFVSKKKYQELEKRIEKLEQQVFEDNIHYESWLLPSHDEPTLRGKVNAVIKQQRLEISVKNEKREVIARKKQ